jgi:hypothetical protein
MIGNCHKTQSAVLFPKQGEYEPDKMRKRGGGAIMSDQKWKEALPPISGRRKYDGRGVTRRRNSRTRTGGAIDAAYHGTKERNITAEARAIPRRLKKDTCDKEMD